MIRTEVYSHLPMEAKEIRQTVFIEEQGFQNEYDERDETATHLVLFHEETPVATCRIFPGEESGVYLLGRLAVRKEYRGCGMGSRVLQEAETCVRSLGGESLMLHSQMHAQEFYQKSGYQSFGEVEYEEDCPHIWMKKKLN